MQKVFIALALMVSTVFTGLNAQNAQLPNTQIQDINGQKTPFNTIFEDGKVTLVSVWATWCMPCIKEINNITKNLEEWQKETPDMNYLIISIDEFKDIAKSKSFIKSRKWAMPAYFDPNSDLKRSLSFDVPPFAMIIDKKGNIAFSHIGYETGGEFHLYEKVKEIAGKE